MKLAKATVHNKLGTWSVEVTKGINNFYSYVKFVTNEGQIGFLEQTDCKTLKVLNARTLLKILPDEYSEGGAPFHALGMAFQQAEAACVTPITGP